MRFQLGMLWDAKAINRLQEVTSPASSSNRTSGKRAPCEIRYQQRPTCGNGLLILSHAARLILCTDFTANPAGY